MTAVVHLVRHANGMAPFEAFMDSYERHDAGKDHDLILLFKGFPSAEGLAPFRRRAAGKVAHELQVPDDGLDVGAYLAAARELSHERLCFLNSFSTIEADDWLGLLSQSLDMPDVGVVGATGSWGSHRSFVLFLLRLPSPYRKVLGDRHTVSSAFQSIGTGPELGRLRRLVRAAGNVPREIVGYSGFPAVHVRTNAFLIERELLLSLAVGGLRSKPAAYRFEGGRRGLTAQVLARGLGALIVGRDGQAFPSERWPEADIFWQRAQRNLLVADNQTRAYTAGSPSVRETLARFAWGDRARVE